MTNDINIRSPAYYVAITHRCCWHCGKSIRLLALALPQTHETLHLETPADGGNRGEPAANAWQCAGSSAFLFYVEYLPETVQAQFRRRSASYQVSYSNATLNSYWANRCEHCGAVLDDHELHCEPDGAFLPSSPAGASGIQLAMIEECFEGAAAGYSFDPEFFSFMRKA
jgi:hypothetical protein